MLIPDIFNQCPYSFPDKGVLHVGAFKCDERPFYNKYQIKDEDILWIDALAELVDINKGLNIHQAVISDVDDETVNFTVTNNIASSSMLNLKEHLIEHPHIHEIKKIPLKTTTLNTFYEKNNIPYDRYDFINLDIQGTELKALKGATKILPYIKTIYTEVNLKEIYEDNGLLGDIDDFLKKYNFIRIHTNITMHQWGDACYIKLI